MVLVFAAEARRGKHSVMAEQPENEVYLSAQHIREWKGEYEALITERSTLNAQITELQGKQGEVSAKIASIGQKLQLAIPFSPGLSEWIQEQEFSATPDNVTLTNAILKAFLRVPGGHAMPRQNIAHYLPQVGYPAQKLQANPNYLYIALKRLVDRKLIEEAHSGHFRLTNEGRMAAQKQR